MTPFTVEVERDQGAVRIVVQGELDMDTGPRLRDELERACAEAPARIVLDLRPVTFFDSTGLQLVLDAEVRCRDVGTEYIVLPGDGEPRRVLELADVTDRLVLEE
jgi:anti-sigma B factor antagonist